MNKINDKKKQKKKFQNIRIEVEHPEIIEISVNGNIIRERVNNCIELNNILYNDITITPSSNLKINKWYTNDITFSKEQIEYNRRNKIVKGRNSNLYYKKYENRNTPKFLMISFPPMYRKNNVNYFASNLTQITEKNPNIVAYSFLDVAGFCGNVMQTDAFGNNIENDIIRFIKKKCQKYNISEENVIFYGNSKGASACLFLQEYFPNSYYFLTSPIIDLNSYMEMNKFINIDKSFCKYKNLGPILETANKNKTFIHYARFDPANGSHIYPNDMNTYCGADHDHYSLVRPSLCIHIYNITQLVNNAGYNFSYSRNIPKGKGHYKHRYPSIKEEISATKTAIVQEFGNSKMILRGEFINNSLVVNVAHSKKAYNLVMYKDGKKIISKANEGDNSNEIMQKIDKDYKFFNIEILESKKDNIIKMVGKRNLEMKYNAGSHYLMNIPTHIFDKIKLESNAAVTFSNSKQLSKNQKEFNERYGMKTYYGKHGSINYASNIPKGEIKAILFTFPGMGNTKYGYPISFMSTIAKELKHTAIIAIQDDNLTFGNYLYKNVEGTSYVPIIRDFIEVMIAKTGANRDKVMLFGSSKGASILLNYVEYFPNYYFFINIPQISLSYYLQKRANPLLRELLLEECEGYCEFKEFLPSLNNKNIFYTFAELDVACSLAIDVNSFSGINVAMLKNADHEGTTGALLPQTISYIKQVEQYGKVIDRSIPSMPDLVIY